MDSDPRPKLPVDLKAPGLLYRLRRQGWEMWWYPRSDIKKRGYQGRQGRLWGPHRREPTRAEWETISAWCHRHDTEQKLWARGGAEGDAKSLFDGTISGLIAVYQKHPKSPYQKLRHGSQKQYASALASLNDAIGKVRVKHITFEDISDWQDRLADDGNGGKPMKARAANLIGALKRLVVFGALVLPKEAGCHDVRDIFATMAEAKLMGTWRRQRAGYMTAAQARLLRAKAHDLGHHSVALEQAIAFELGVRQKDVIGEWIPRDWPGVTDIYAGPRKWLLGMRWEDIDENMTLTHRLSKSLRSKDAVMDAEAGKVKAWDLREYPMIVDELRRLSQFGASDDAGKRDITRADLPARGPLIVRESTGLPWGRSEFKDRWRAIARAAGLPDALQNRDSRPGAATEADLAGADKDKVRRGLGHAKGETTDIYLRDDLEVNRELARRRVEKRK
jgi:hypothetical protein